MRSLAEQLAKKQVEGRQGRQGEKSERRRPAIRTSEGQGGQMTND
ncbi:hypothetical protein NIES2100_77430 [Calothrix sp. NIES-2100]|nr:hypothetical protein NIES2100_77430 [Calothrix sp. NIES-2100]